MKSIKIILLALVVLGAVFFAIQFLGNGDMSTKNQPSRPTEDPLDVALSLAGNWLLNLQSTTSIPLADFLAGVDYIHDDVAAKLLTGAAVDSEIDPILCQQNTPARVGAKPVYVSDYESQVMVVARGGEKTPQQSLITLEAVDGQWLIVDVSCSNGEVGKPVGEFSFVQTGRLVRQSVPAPYDSETWHVIFNNEDGSIGVVPLYWYETSVCVKDEVSESCNLDDLEEGQVVRVLANMTEQGADVGRIELP